MIILAPSSLAGVHLADSVFLAGSIDMGEAEDWQSTMAAKVSAKGLTALNPRRDDWDDSWVQSIEHPQFKEQVEWELDAMDLATVIAYHFSAGSKSPITLLEFGLHARTDKQVVFCPEGFYRRGNVEIVCHRYGIPLYGHFGVFLDAVIMKALEAQKEGA